MRNDRRLKALRLKFGITGYAVYNLMLEVLSEADLLVIYLDETELQLLAGDFNIEAQELKIIIDYSCDIGLFRQRDKWIYCPQLDERSKIVFGKRTRDLDSLRSGKGVFGEFPKQKLPETDVSATESTQSKAKQSKGKESKGSKKISFFDGDKIARVIEAFKESYHEIRGMDYEITNSGKERTAATKLTKLYIKKYPDADPDEIIDGLRTYFDACLEIEDKWLFENMSIPIIVNQFNKINTILRYGKSGKSKGTSDEELAKIIADNFATDKPE